MTFTRLFASSLYLLAYLSIGVSALAQTPATAPAKTGDIDLTFTQRSPQSFPKELARRLAIKATDVTSDYDLSTKPYKAFIPTRYDPVVPHGILVYLGYKDSVATPKPWQSLLEKSHLIFITPVSHTSMQYEGSIPLWQTLGLAFDAVHNLKQQYTIDPKRIYLMALNDSATQLSLGATDVFTGFIIGADAGYFRKINMSGGRFLPPTFPLPPAQYLRIAQNRPFVLLDTFGDNPNKIISLKANAMKQDGITRVITPAASLTADLHYPDFKVDWFENDALPFLDKNGIPAVPTAVAHATTRPATNASPSVPATPAVQSQAGHLLSMAQLYIKNGQSELARAKLQQIIDVFPNDPAAGTAKQLLQQLSEQAPR